MQLGASGAVEPLPEIQQRFRGVGWTAARAIPWMPGMNGAASLILAANAADALLR